MQHDMIQTLLESGCDVSVNIRNVLVRQPRWYQMFRQIPPAGAVSLAILSGVIEFENWDANPSAWQQFYGLLKNNKKKGRISVVCQAHDLVFVGINIETYMQSD